MTGVVAVVYGGVELSPPSHPTDLPTLRKCEPHLGDEHAVCVYITHNNLDVLVQDGPTIRHSRHVNVP